MQPKLFVIAKVIIVRPDGQILALRRSETDTRRPLQWDFPGGFVEPGEEFRTAVMREAEEEAGIRLTEPPELAYAMSEHEQEKDVAGTWLLFVAHVTDTPEVRTSYEHDQYRWAKPRDLLKDITYHRQQKMLSYLLDTGILSEG